jgi:two-component sensor histidine kinase
MAPEHLRFFYRLRRYGEDWPKEWQEAEDGQFLLSEMTAGMHELQLKCAYFYYSHHERALINTYSLYFEYKWSETLWFQFVVAFFCIVSGSLVYYSVKMAQDKKAKSIEILEINKRLQKTNEEVTKQATELKKRQQELDSHNLKIGELYKSVSESNEVLRQQKNEISTQAELLSDAYERLEIKNKEISFLKESLEHDLKNNLLKMQNIVDFPLESISPEGKETFRRYQAELAGILKTYRYMLAKEQHSANMLKELAEEECDRHYRPDIEVKMYCNMSFNRPEHRDRLPQINIIVTELARNAAKHAFPLRIQDPQIIFRIEPDEENRITITYQDNGIGIKDMASISTDAKGIALFRRVSIDQYFVCHNQPDGGLYVAIRLDNRPMLL